VVDTWFHENDDIALFFSLLLEQDMGVVGLPIWVILGLSRANKLGLGPCEISLCLVCSGNLFVVPNL
jgi:hypothetical protein